MITFPGSTWQRTTPVQAGFSAEKLNQSKSYLEEHNNGDGFRFVVIRYGKVVYELYQGFQPDERLRIASAAKSLYANILGIAIAEQRIPDEHARVVDYYPEMMAVSEGQGPKEGRYAFPKDAGITFQQLISNTSGYMKPGEETGKVFHYQTYGMNILTHTLASIYGFYDTASPHTSPGFGALIQQKLALPIGAEFDYSHTNFALHDKARLEVFGNYCQVFADPLNLGRLGWLWCNMGQWEGKQVIPANWMQLSVKVPSNILTNCPEEDWKYGLGFWTNNQNRYFPGFPTDMFSASGAGGHYVTVYPSLSLVVVQNPGPYQPDAGPNFALQQLVLDALED